MSATSPPTLLTSRLRLRAFRADDLDALATMYADAEVMRHIRGGPCEVPRTQEQTAASVELCTAAGQENGYGVWAVVDCVDRRLLGTGHRHGGGARLSVVWVHPPRLR